MHPPCPHCDQPDMSLLRLVLIGEILRADATVLVLLADLVQQSGRFCRKFSFTALWGMISSCYPR